MSRYIAFLLLSTFAAVTIAEFVPPKETLVAEIKTGMQKRGSGPKMMMCGEKIIERKRYVCNARFLVEKDSDDDQADSGLLDRVEANSFLNGGIAKRGLTEECCHEGCKWEEVLEHC